MYSLSCMNYCLTKFIWAFSIETRSNKSLSFADKWIHACLHFQQTLSIEALPPSCLWVWIKAPTGLVYTIYQFFNGDVHDKTSDLFTHKENNFHSEGWMNWIHFKSKIFQNIKSQIWDKVRNVLMKSIQWNQCRKVNTCIHCHVWITVSPSLFEPFQSKPDPTNHCPLQTNEFMLVCTFNKHCLLRHYPHHVFGSGSRLQQG